MNSFVFRACLGFDPGGIPHQERKERQVPAEGSVVLFDDHPKVGRWIIRILAAVACAISLASGLDHHDRSVTGTGAQQLFLTLTQWAIWTWALLPFGLWLGIEITLFQAWFRARRMVRRGAAPN